MRRMHTTTTRRNGMARDDADMGSSGGRVARTAAALTTCLLFAAAGCGGGKTTDGPGTAGTTSSGASSSQAAEPPTSATPKDAVAMAKSITERVCGCKDATCGEKVFGEAKQAMPPLMKQAGPADRAMVDEERKKAFACMDKLVADDPAVKAAMGAVADLERDACACSDQACAEKVVAAAREPMAKALDAELTKDANLQFRASMAKATDCLAKVPFKGSTLEDFAARARAATDAVCACTTSACLDESLRKQGQMFAPAFTPDDMAVVREEAGRASACVKSAANTPDKSMCGKRSDPYAAYQLDSPQAAGRYGARARTYAEAPTTPAQPVEVCGVPAQLAWLVRVTCADGSSAFKSAQDAHGSRKGTAMGGRCGDSMLDIYRATCPEKTYDVHIDMNMCGPGEKFL